MKNSKSLPKGGLNSSALIPPSKSYANRALIIAARQSRAVELSGLPAAQDVTDLLRALKILGLEISMTHDGCIVHNSFPECETQDLCIEIGEGGTSARFLACLLATGQKKYELILRPELAKRPWQEFIDFMRQHGGAAELKGSSLFIQGPVRIPEGLIEVDCRRTTQFASGIQLTQGASVKPSNLKASESYWKMTLYLSKVLKRESSFRIPLDWSSASYPMVFAALNHPIHFPGLSFDPFQADAKLYDILKRLDALEESVEGITVHALKRPGPLCIEASDCLDLVPALAFLMAHIEGQHRLRGVENLIHKESDRLTGVLELLKTFDRKASFEAGELIIEGHKDIADKKILQLENDHRMVMSGALFLRHHSGGSLCPASAVRKSYPEFFNLFNS